MMYRSVIRGQQIQNNQSYLTQFLSPMKEEDQEFEVLSPIHTSQEFPKEPHPKFNTFLPLPLPRPPTPIPYPLFLDSETSPPLPLPLPPPLSISHTHSHSHSLSLQPPASSSPKPLDLFLTKIHFFKTFQSPLPFKKPRPSLPRSSSQSLRPKTPHPQILLKPTPILTSNTKLISSSYQVNSKSIPSLPLHSQKFTKRYQSTRTTMSKEKEREIGEGYSRGKKKQKKGLPRVELEFPVGVRRKEGEMTERGGRQRLSVVEIMGRGGGERKKSVSVRRSNLDKVIEDLIENPRMVKAGILNTFIK